MSIWIEAVATVKLFKVEEPKDSQPAASAADALARLLEGHS